MMNRIVIFPLIAVRCTKLIPAGAPVYGGVDDYQAGSAAFAFPAVDAISLNLTCEFTVPSKPPSWDGDTQVYLWCGINWYDGEGQCLGVMQPVLTYGCSPNAFGGMGCGTDESDPQYADDPYWYFSSQYVLGWAEGQAFGSKNVLRVEPGDVLYSEMSYNVVADTWMVIGRNQRTNEASTYAVAHPAEDASRSWSTVHADSRTSATTYAVSEPHQVNDARSQMPPITDFRFNVLRPVSELRWSGGQGTAALVQQGGPQCADDASVSKITCEQFAAGAQCTNDATWCQLCAETCGALGASCGCVNQDPPQWDPTIIGMDLTWQTAGIVIL